MPSQHSLRSSTPLHIENGQSMEEYLTCQNPPMFHWQQDAMSAPKRPQQKAKRLRTTYSKNQLQYLEAMFEDNQYPDVYAREQIASELDLTDLKVQVWFKNKRQKHRLMQKGGKLDGKVKPYRAQRTRLPVVVTGSMDDSGVQSDDDVSSQGTCASRDSAASSVDFQFGLNQSASQDAWCFQTGPQVAAAQDNWNFAPGVQTITPQDVWYQTNQCVPDIHQNTVNYINQNPSHIGVDTPACTTDYTIPPLYYHDNQPSQLMTPQEIIIPADFALPYQVPSEQHNNDTRDIDSEITDFLSTYMSSQVTLMSQFNQ